MYVNEIKDLEIVAHVLTIAKTHEISTNEAIDLYIKQIKFELEQKQFNQINLSSFLKEKLSPDNWESVMRYVYHHPTNEELYSAYYQAKFQGSLKSAKLLVGGSFFLRNSDFVGKKYLEPGTIVEAEVYISNR